MTGGQPPRGAGHELGPVLIAALLIGLVVAGILLGLRWLSQRDVPPTAPPTPVPTLTGPPFVSP
ncbi:hypothetical protein [Micromonospora sp. NPDC004704]